MASDIHLLSAYHTHTHTHIITYIFVFLFGNKVKASDGIYANSLKQSHFKLYTILVFLVILYNYTETSVVSKELNENAPLKSGQPARVNNTNIYIKI